MFLFFLNCSILSHFNSTLSTLLLGQRGLANCAMCKAFYQLWSSASGADSSTTQPGISLYRFRCHWLKSQSREPCAGSLLFRTKEMVGCSITIAPNKSWEVGRILYYMVQNIIEACGISLPVTVFQKLLFTILLLYLDFVSVQRRSLAT